MCKQNQDEELDHRRQILRHKNSFNFFSEKLHVMSAGFFLNLLDVKPASLLMIGCKKMQNTTNQLVASSEAVYALKMNKQ
ncbi:MAG: hypothetical protein RBR87_09120 [Bacteroidales bacterium]|jgi:hypothetical protein|nr:hypothetical protein [Bacteroidales bacterium]